MLLIFVILFNLILFSSATCPLGSTPFFKDKIHCLIFQTNKTYYLDAEEICINLGGHLVSVHDSTDNMFLSQQALAKFTDSTDSDFWFGANDLSSPQKWTWMDDTPFDYSNWDKGQPVDTEGNNCGAVLMHGGKWKSDDCYKAKPYVCMVNDDSATSSTKTVVTTTTETPKSCPLAWTYYNNHCYKIYENLNWLDGETKCSIDHAHLASVHSLEEALFIAYTAYYQNINVCEWVQHAWIGLFTEDNNAHWNWTDGTPFDYSKWIPTQPDGPGSQNCGYIRLTDCPTGLVARIGDFDNAFCNQALAKVVCKKPL